MLIKEQIPKYLGAQTKIVTTQCIILEVEKLSKISKCMLVLSLSPSDVSFFNDSILHTNAYNI